MAPWDEWRVNLRLGAAYLVILEAVSWLPAPSGSACVVNPANYGAYYAEHNECPAFHVFLLKILARILEVLGDPNWVVAIFTIVLAGSTIALWIVTWQSGVRQSRDMQAAVAESRRSADAAMLAV